jgi:ATP-dependent Clp protease ATP-binding subunit ClpA
VEEAAVALLAEQGYEPEYGARPLRRVLRRRIENPLATHLLEDRFRGCSGVRIEAVAASEGEAGSLRFVPQPKQGEDVR